MKYRCINGPMISQCVHSPSVLRVGDTLSWSVELDGVPITRHTYRMTGFESLEWVETTNS